jgi:hypothetical protein
MVTETRETSDLQQATNLQPGPYWASFEQFRLAGVDGLRADLGPDEIGRLNVKGDEFVIMRSDAFTRLCGVAREIDRLSQQVHLVRQAVQLLQESAGSEVAVQHVCDLVGQLPELTVQHPRKTELVFDEDEQLRLSDYEAEDLDFELDPAKVRPTWSRG